MISKKNKISKQFFPQVMKGKRKTGVFADIIITPSLSYTFHAGVVISKKNVKTAVMRNIVKRLFYNRISLKKDVIPQKTYILYIKKPVTKESLEEFKKDLYELCEFSP